MTVNGYYLPRIEYLRYQTHFSARSRSERIHWSKSDTVGIPPVGDTSPFTVISSTTLRTCRSCRGVFGPRIRSDSHARFGWNSFRKMDPWRLQNPPTAPPGLVGRRGRRTTRRTGERGRTWGGISTCLTMRGRRTMRCGRWMRRCAFGGMCGSPGCSAPHPFRITFMYYGSPNTIHVYSFDNRLLLCCKASLYLVHRPITVSDEYIVSYIAYISRTATAPFSLPNSVSMSASLLHSPLRYGYCATFPAEGSKHSTCLPLPYGVSLPPIA